MTAPLYSVGTWDCEEQAYTPYDLTHPAFNITRKQLKEALRRLRSWNYTAHRFGNSRDGHDDNDWSVLVERTDGIPEEEIIARWVR